MALKKQITISQPFEADRTAEYWVIKEKTEIKRHNFTTVLLVCYKNREESKTEHPDEYMRINFQFDGLDFKRSDLYPMIKLDSRFVDATDV